MADKPSSDGTPARSSLKQRAAQARADASATKAWSAIVTAATAGTLWRVASAWIEQRDRTHCAELTDAGTEAMGACRSQILGE
jgi:hypothetical protein